jgi:menaquinone-dependent protoporphyrinogen oxidase
MHGEQGSMARILILYSTTDGHTVEICRRITQTIEMNGDNVELQDIKDGPELVPLVHEFIKKNQSILESHPNAFFSVNVVARKPEKNQPETNPYLQKFLKKIDWKPQRLAVFAGKIDYPSLGFVDKQMIRFIMWMTKGPTDPNAVVEFTDWDKVDEFGRMITKM